MTTEERLYHKVGLALAEARLALNMTQAKLAQKVRMSRSSVANIESGRQRLSLHQLFILAKALKVAVTAILPP